MNLLVRGKYVITDAAAGEDGILADGAAYISGGRILEVGDYGSLAKKYPRATRIGNARQLLMPGLIDGHSHGWGLTSIQRGILFDFLENALLDWAFSVILDPKLNAMMSGIRHVRNGCTAVHHNTFGEPQDPVEMAEKTIEGYQTVGIRLAYSSGPRNENRLALDDMGFFATLPPDLQELTRPLVYFDRQAVVEDYFELFEYLYGKYDNEDLHIIFGPSWVQGTTDDFLRRIKTTADRLGKIQIHTHTLQTPIQKAFGLRRYRKSLVAHLDDLGLVDENLTLGHAVYLTESDIALLASRGASVTHHPSCNLAMRNGIAPVYHMHRAGVNVALGIDDKAINDDEDAIMELRMIHRLHRIAGFDLTETPALGAFDVLRMGTINAARVCGFEGDLGAIKPGMKADVILVDLDEIMEDPWMSPELNVAEIFIHRAKGSHVNTVIVGGEVVMQDRNFVNVDVARLYDEVRRQAAKGISPRQRAFAEVLKKIKPYYQKWYKGWVEELDLQPFYVLNSRA